MEKFSTPLMEQYNRIKGEHPDEILFFRMGDFYEMFGEDAKVASKILGIALTSRAHGKMERVPLAGVPYHSAEKYLTKLLKAGKKVVVCEQTEDPRKAKGLVRREIVEIITPGTITLDQALDGQENNYLASIFEGKDRFGLALIELSIGEFKTDEVLPEKLKEMLNTIAPAELLIPEEWELSKKEELKKGLNFVFTFTPLEGWKFSYDYAFKLLTEHFKVSSLEGFGVQELKSGISSAGAILSYLNQTKKTLLTHLNKISRISNPEEMFLDSNTIRNLELLSSSGTKDKDYTLFSLLNQTKTPMGSRLLKNWIIRPLLNQQKIKERQEGVREFYDDRNLSESIGEKLDSISDLERLSGKLGYGKANPKDLIGLKESLKVIPEIRNALQVAKSSILKEISVNLPEVSDIVKLIEDSIVDDPSLSLTEGGIIRKGFDQGLDDLKKDVSENKNWIAQLEKNEKERTGIPSLKVGFNQIFGYYIEITRPHLSKVPPDYIRKQTMVNAERFVTPELKEREAKILGAEEKIFQMEYDLFLKIRDQVAFRTQEIQLCAELLARLDLLLSFSNVARENHYVVPEIDNEDLIWIEEGRHPVIEQILEYGAFIPNDTKIGEDERIHIITGPNMAGKSTYLRQVGLMVLLAQIGSFVPAKKAKIGIVDRIFTRVGAMDNIALGQSTFLVEMNETANILNNATPKSLILLDEIGRGTSTFDGLSIAWSVTEYLHNNEKLCAKTLFATHYHELTELAKYLPRLRNYNVAVKEWEDEIIFLRKIVPGGCDDSYGIQVARLAGIPREVLERAKVILSELESGEYTYEKLSKPKTETIARDFQLSFFSPSERLIYEELKKIEIEKLTPLEALNKLEEMKRKISRQ
ncbi:MAG: DNA mismatch repair protein MutS [candidate division Zixibacteria bacterium RBG_16_43_9]|nr:MAG: DNA mismatch repair protein MutS [candidate division Zixibacteria bacterium RBG_16_43_9]